MVSPKWLQWKGSLHIFFWDNKYIDKPSVNMNVTWWKYLYTEGKYEFPTPSLFLDFSVAT